MEPRKVNLLYDVRPEVLTLCKQGANRKRIFLKKEAERADEGKLIALPGHESLIKKGAGDSWSHFYCVVAEPGNLEDPGSGDGMGSGVDDLWRDSDEIRKAAHHFAKSDKLVTGLHDTMEPFGVVVENAIAHADFTVLDDLGVEQTIRKGSWYVAIEPSDEGKAKIDQGEFTGLSLEGPGFRELAEIRKQDGDDEKRTLLRKVATYLGLGDPLPGDSGTVSTTTDSEDENVDAEAIKKAVSEETDELRKEVSATSNAINKLTDLVEKLSTKFSERESKDGGDGGDGEGKTSPADLKKAVDALSDKVNGALDKLDEKIDALAEDGSSQGGDGDQLRKNTSDDPLAGILD